VNSALSIPQGAPTPESTVRHSLQPSVSKMARNIFAYDTCLTISDFEVGHCVCQLSSQMFPRPLTILQRSRSYDGEPIARQPETVFDPIVGSAAGIIEGIQRRWARERRRRKVGRAYDMALEIARVIPRGSEVLDVGCGNGFIAHHLSAMLGASVVGIDLGDSADAPIDYRRYDGARFPAPDNSFDAVLLCYVLHHAQDVRVVLSDMRRVLRVGGLAVVYEDVPHSWWDRLVCNFHNRQWKNRTGPCTFRLESQWRALFNSFGFEISSERPLSRWRNLTHPVCRRFYMLKLRPQCLMRYLGPAVSREANVIRIEKSQQIDEGVLQSDHPRSSLFEISVQFSNIMS
jgi:SAM-dependent methyltransferase